MANREGGIISEKGPARVDCDTEFRRLSTAALLR
jgi:hypothetical protein